MIVPEACYSTWFAKLTHVNAMQGVKLTHILADISYTKIFPLQTDFAAIGPLVPTSPVSAKPI